MSVIQQNTDETILKCENWCRLAICVNNPVKSALIAILHNTVSDSSINGLPEDPTLLFNHMYNCRNKLKNNKYLKQDQLAELLPQEGKVFSESLDVTMLRFLIRTFCNIVNEDGHWGEPRHDDHSIAAGVFRAANMRNRVFHYKDPNAMEDIEFETMWCEIEVILADLCYVEDISDFKVNSLDPVAAKKLKQIHDNTKEDFEKILVAYKEKCKNDENEELDTFVKRKFKDKNTKDIIEDFNTLVNNHDLVMVSGEAGLGKTFSAKYLRHLWASDKILQGCSLLFINSKRVNKYFYKPSNASLISVTELRDILIDKNDEYLALFECVTKPIEDLVIIIDGIDELPIKENTDSDFFKKLQIKIDKNENISAIDTIMGIYFGFFFPGSKVIAYGRKHEIERLENIQNELQKNNLSNKKSQVVLELQEFEEEDVKELISRDNCGIESCECEKCTETYNFVKDVEFRNIPSHLVALIKIFKYLPNPNFGRITKTKIILITIFNLLKNHTQTVFFEDVKTFKKLLTFEKAKEFRECIQNIAEISFFSLLDENVTIQVEAYNENDVDYFKYEQTAYRRNICVKIKRDILEQLDFFYIRDLEYDNFILEPHHLSNMEFLASCHIHCHPDEWNLLLFLNADRKTIILPYVAGLYSNENFTKDFVCEILQNTSNGDVETYLSWLFSVEGVGRVRCLSFIGSWFGLKENGQLFPSFDLLHRINEEVDVVENISEKLKEVQTIVCCCRKDFEWYDMEEFQHKFLTYDVNKYNVKSFISKFQKYQIIVKGDIRIRNNEQFNLLLEMFNNDKIKFRIYYLQFSNNTQHRVHLTKHLKCNALQIGLNCDSRSIDFLLNASSLSNATTSSPTIKCKRLYINDIAHFNDQQIEKLFSIGLSDVVDNITLRSIFFTDGQLAILEKVERNANKMINIELWFVKFSDMFGLPNLGNRHVSLISVNDVTDNDVNKFKEHISSGYSDNLSNYKIIASAVPFVRKENYSRDVEHSMFLNLFNVNFTQVSSDVFKNTFSIIPSLSCFDNDYIQSAHWSSLSADDCRINELRVWSPKPKNFQHFLNIKNNLIQFICHQKSSLEQLLTHIVNNSNVQFDKQIKVFVVKYDNNDWDYYDEITLFGRKTIEAYKKDHISDDLLLANSPETFREGNPDTWWCCEISSPAKKNTDDPLQGFSDNNESFVEKNEDELNEIRIIGDVVYYKVVKGNTSNY